MSKHFNPKYKPSVAVIGGINVDVTISADSLEYGQMNEGESSHHLGGVGWNVAHNLKKLQIPVKLVSAVGSDIVGKEALGKVKALDIDTRYIIQRKETSSTMIMHLSSESGKETVGVKAANALNAVTADYLKSIRKELDECEYFIIDGSVSPDVITFVSDNFPEAMIFLDPASEDEAEKLKGLIDQVDSVKPNESEVEVWTGMSVNNKNEAEKAVEDLLSKGVKQVILPLDDGGAVYSHGDSVHYINGKKVDPISPTGAGDAFLSAFVYGLSHEYALEDCVKFAVAASTLTLKSKETVSPDLSVEKLQTLISQLTDEPES